jgi:hypothetical protein
MSVMRGIAKGIVALVKLAALRCSAVVWFKRAPSQLFPGQQPVKDRAPTS